VLSISQFGEVSFLLNIFTGFYSILASFGYVFYYPIIRYFKEKGKILLIDYLAFGVFSLSVALMFLSIEVFKGLFVVITGIDLNSIYLHYLSMYVSASAQIWLLNSYLFSNASKLSVSLVGIMELIGIFLLVLYMRWTGNISYPIVIYCAWKFILYAIILNNVYLGVITYLGHFTVFLLPIDYTKYLLVLFPLGFFLAYRFFKANNIHS
jgi:hypothetical protein